MGSDISPRVKREQSVGLRGLAPVGCVDQAFLADRNDDVIRAASGTSAVCFRYPVSPGLIPATAYFADAAKRAALKVVVNMSQISAREDSKSHAARDHRIAERLFDWSGVPTVHIRPTFFAEWLLLPFVRSTIVEKGIIDLPYGNGRHAPIAAEDRRGSSRPSWRSRPLMSGKPIPSADRLSWIRPESPRPSPRCWVERSAISR